ncbi:MAG TPA: porin family protein [Saprospiraceae bacterium]|nr:porin family protein [Saprospiraceae bacterium]HMP14512.1 porin family protein [Saprospiraceae bacterium]
MSDKRFEEQFIDESWEQMRALLDQEMPVKDKRRRLAPIIWIPAAAASVVLFIIAGSWWFTQYQERINDSLRANHVIANAYHNAITEPPCDEIIQTAPIASMQLPRQQPTKSTTFDATAALQETAQPIVLPSSEAAPFVATTTMQISEDNNRVVTSEDVSHAAYIIRHVEQIESLHHSPTTAALTTTPDLKIPLTKTTPRQSAWRVGVEIAGFSNGYVAMSGYAGGALIDAPTIAGESMNVRTGVNYSARSQHFDVSASKVKLDRVDASGGGGGMGVVTIDDTPGTLSLHTQHVSLPVALHYKLQKKWGLEGGLQTAYLVNASNLRGTESYQMAFGAANNSENTIRSFINDLTEKHSNQSAGSNEVNIDRLRRFDLGATLGVSYYPYSYIGVRLQYQHGLTDLLRDERFSAFNHHMRVSAVYFFR